VDIDPTDDPTHGQQDLPFFHGHYDTWCSLPVVGTLPCTAERTPHLVPAILRPGNAPATLGALGILRRLRGTRRTAFPHARLRIRLDGGCAPPALVPFLEAEGVEYLVAMASNAKLEPRVRRLLGKARMRSKATGETATRFGETRYAATSWRRKRRGILKADVGRRAGRDPRDTPRFVVPNLPPSPRRGYAISRDRGDVENRRKERHSGLGVDRPSGSRFGTTACRGLLTAAADVLLQTLRARLAATPAAGYQVAMLRDRLFPRGTRVQVSARRIVLPLPAAFPGLALWQAVALTLGASPG